ncbi:MAG: DUF1987 domain-containing protein [Leptospiraceae bacterium]|nr:DUF1987 domain-containing protein [Leptospiraceae bacterium]MCP5511894.1 DUF1987 domain-containing protein [Leptospiraceae bacterium]
MENLKILATRSTPEIVFDAGARILSMKGESYPEHTAQFFEPIVKWIRDFLSGQDQEFLLEIDLKYFNSSSSRILYTIFEMLEEASKSGKLITVNWCFDEDNEIAEEHGEEFKEDLHYLNFNLVSRESE